MDAVRESVWRSYAKVNLYLEILGRRRDGYHRIETVFQTVDLSDELHFERAGALTLSCSDATLDAGASNLVMRAAMLLRERTGCPYGARIHLIKRIPVAAGLAGGSGNAAATLAALNVMWGLNLPAARLTELGRLLGADVPYCLSGGAAAATQRGDDIHPLPPAGDLWFVLVCPGIPISAGALYTHPLLEYGEERVFAGRTPAFRRALRALARGEMEKVVFNRMERPAFHDHPVLAVIKAHLLESGCVAAAMSGSGSTVFGVCSTREQALSAADAVRVAHGFTVYVVSTVSAGVARTV